MKSGSELSNPGFRQKGPKTVQIKGTFQALFGCFLTFQPLHLARLIPFPADSLHSWQVGAIKLICGAQGPRWLAEARKAVPLKKFFGVFLAKSQGGAFLAINRCKRKNGPKTGFWHPLHFTLLLLFSANSTWLAFDEAIKLIYEGRIPKWVKGGSWYIPCIGKKALNQRINQCKSSGLWESGNPSISLRFQSFLFIRHV